MREIVKLILNGESRGLDETLNRSGRNIRTFGDRANAVFSRLGRTIKYVSDSALTPFAGVATAAGLAMAGKGVIDFDARLARLAIQAGMTTKETMALKAELLDASRKTYQLPTELLSGMEQIVEKTGNLKLAKDTILDMGYAASATGAEMASIGAVTSNLNEKLDITQKEMRGAFDILNEQGKAGAFTLKELSTLGERLFTSAASWGVKGTEGLRRFGAFVQIARRGTGSSEMATTAVERTIADLLQKSAKVKAVTGFSIFDEAASKKEGRAVMKDFDVVLKEVIKRTKGDTVKLRKIFGEESIRAIDAMALAYRKTGDFRVFDEFVKQGGDGTQMMSDFARWSETATAKLVLFRAELSKLANENLAGPIELFTQALDLLNRHPVVTKGGIAAILGLAGMAAAMKTFGWLKDAFDILFGKSGNGKGLPGTGGLPGIGKTPIPVYVVNSMPGSSGSGWNTGGTIPGKNVPGAGGIAGWLKKLGPLAAGKLGLAGGIGYAFGTGINLTLGELTGKGPGWLGEMLYDFIHERETPEVKNNIDIILGIDSDGRVKATTSDMNTNINLPRGKF